MTNNSSNINKLASVIILNFNALKYIKNCLDSLKRQTYPNMEVIFVDNASTDNSADYVQRNFPWVCLVENPSNLGFAEGNNIGVTYSHGDYLIFLNDDTEVDSRWLEKLIEAAESSSSIAICGSKLLDMENRKLIQEAGGLVDKYGYSLSRGLGEIDNGQYNGIFETFYVSGASLLIKREIGLKLGFFDSKYFFNEDDVDLCWRARLCGYKVVVNCNSILYHKGGGSAKGAPGSSSKGGKFRTTAWRRYYHERNILITLLKNYSFRTLLTIIPIYLMLYFCEISFYLIIGEFKVAKANLNAILWNIKNIKYTFNERKRVQSMRVLSDKEVQAYMISGSGKIKRFMQVGIPKFD